MKMLRRTLISIAVLLVLATSVEAATLFSAPLSAVTGLVTPPHYTFVCRIVNVSDKAREVTLEIVYALDGTVLASFTVLVEPGTGTFTNSTADTLLAGAYCKANVTGPKANWRGTFNVEETVGFVNVLTIATTPLQ